MFIRPSTDADLPRLIELTIEAFRPFFEDSFRPLVGETIFLNQHGGWREDYRAEIPGLCEPEQHKYVAVADMGEGLAGYVAWSADPPRRNGTISHLAVAAEYRRDGIGAALCEHAFTHLRDLGAEVVVIGTGGDPFHAPARALYESLGCTGIPVAVYFRRL